MLHLLLGSEEVIVIAKRGGMAAAEGMAWGLPGFSFDFEALKTYITAHERGVMNAS